MKYSIIIAEKDILTPSDKKTWIRVSQILNKPKQKTTPFFENIIELIKSKFPELPNKMVWGNYLIFEEYGNIITIDIDYDDIDILKTEILHIALANNTVVLIGKEDKIYTDISEIQKI